MPIRIPEHAWSRAIGEGYDPAPRPRVDQPMIDDGPWGGVPIGGIGAGTIGRTQRGDFARWHLRIGEHRFESVALDGFSLWVDDGERTSATVLRTTVSPPGWGPQLPVAAGTYRALFPRSWIEYEPPGVSIRVIEEQLSPVIPGDDAAASLPVGCFEFELANPLDRPVTAAVLLSWRDPLCGRAETFARDDLAGIVFEAPGTGGMAGTFAIAAATRDAEVTTTRVSPDHAASTWQAFAGDGRVLPGAVADSQDNVGAVAVRVSLEAGATRTIRFAIAWDLPMAEFGQGRRWYKRYTREWGTTGTRAVDLAGHALASAPGWQAAIEGWQAPILASDTRPGWYKAALFNELYFLVDGATIWPESPVVPGPETDGLATLGIIECFDYPFYDTLDVHFYAASALVRLWPSLQASISRAYARSVAIDDPEVVTIQASGERAVRKVPGALPHDLGGPAEDPFVRVNHYSYQEVNGWKDLNPKFVLQAWRDRLLDPDPDGFIRDVWPTIPVAMDHLAQFDRDGDGLPEHDGIPDQTYDTWPMTGASAYGGSLWLAALRAASAFARAAGDEERAAAWDADFARGQATFERLLWNGRSYDYDAGGGPTSDSVMADQLVGQWFADVCGLGDIVPAANARSSLRRIYELNVGDFGDGLLGAVNGMRPDGTVDRSSQQSQEVWVGTTYALAAFMIGRGLVTEGWATAEGAVRVVWERGLWFRTPEAYDRSGNYRAPLYLRPLAIWAIEEALERLERDGPR